MEQYAGELLQGPLRWIYASGRERRRLGAVSHFHYTHLQ